MDYFLYIWLASLAILVFLVIYFTFMAEQIMKKKGRLNNWWVMLILLLGPFALIIAIKMKPKPS